MKQETGAPIVIHREDSQDPREVEYKVLFFLGMERKLDWKLQQQITVEKDGRFFNEVTIEIKEGAGDGLYARNEKYYFDVTDDHSQDEHTEPHFPDDNRVCNSDLIDADDGLYKVLDALTLQVNSGWQWTAEDIDQKHAKGVVLKTWGNNEPDDRNMAYVLAVDITEDPSEPEINVLTVTDLRQVDDDLQQKVIKSLQDSGNELTQWIQSEFNEINGIRCLVTAYIANEQGVPREYVTLRLSADDKKYFIQGGYGSEYSMQYSDHVLYALQSVKLDMKATST